MDFTEVLELAKKVFKNASINIEASSEGVNARTKYKSTELETSSSGGSPTFRFKHDPEEGIEDEKTKT